MPKNLIKWKQFESKIIILCVRWYLKYPLSDRMIVEMMEERGLPITHFNFYDITSSNPFYIYSGGSYVQTTASKVTSATHYKTGSTYNRITATPVKIGNVVYFSY